MSENNILDRLKEFIFQERWKYDFLITAETKVREDLKLFGDDAVDFIIAYGKKFNVDISKFMAADYFDNESLLEFKFGSSVKKILTIKHLLKGIEKGKLDEEIINGLSE